MKPHLHKPARHAPVTTHPTPPTPQKLLAEGKFMKVAMAAEKFNAPHAQDVLRTIHDACARADLVVTAALTQTATMCVAERLGVPWVPVFLGPVWPTREFCSWALSATPWRWKWANKKSYSLLLAALWLQEKKRINAWRVGALGLPALKGGPMPVIEGAGGRIPVVLMCTHHMTPGMARPPDYPDFVKVRGAGGLGPVGCGWLVASTGGWDRWVCLTWSRISVLLRVIAGELACCCV